jgi:hypothetical protein
MLENGSLANVTDHAIIVREVSGRDVYDRNET